MHHVVDEFDRERGRVDIVVIIEHAVGGVDDQFAPLDGQKIVCLTDGRVVHRIDGYADGRYLLKCQQCIYLIFSRMMP